jgi:hypothetical protein
MRERRNLALMSRLVVVQRARRLGAEAELQRAAAAEREAREAEAEALARSAESRRDWADNLASPGFSPEFGRALSRRLLLREGEAKEAAFAADRKTEMKARSQQAWRLLEAQVRQTDGSVRRLRRKVGQLAEEKRLGELSERITWSWTKR